jgi:hypothetical protein
MKWLLIVLAAAGLLLLPSVTLAETGVDNKTPSPISQTLVREGDFAVDLAVVMQLGQPTTEAEAEDLLASAGITPKNGWIPDYPITPDILAELEESVGSAADSGTITLSRDDAIKAFEGLAQQYGLLISPSDEEYYAGGSDDEEYYPTDVVDGYYDEYGPPVITYYSPPWDYWYLYSWVDYPFWWYGYWYPGYFILNDFTVVVNYPTYYHRHHRDWDSRAGTWRESGNRVVSNRIRDAGSSAYSRIDPVTGTEEPITAQTGSGEHGRRLHRWSSTDRSAARSIVSRDVHRSKSLSGTVWSSSTDTGRERALGRATRLGSSDRAQTFRRSNMTRDNSFGRSGQERSFTRPSRFGDTQGTPSRSFGMPERGVERSFSRPSMSSGRSFDRQSYGGGRSFSTPARSFEAPSQGGRSFSVPSRSFEAPSGGGFNRGGFGNSGGGFGRGGGCRGGRC